MRRRTVLAAVVALVAAALAPAATLAQNASPEATPIPPAPPTQPASGPGGTDYAYDEIVARHYGDFREAPPAFWLFEPAAPREGTAPAEAPLPLVIFVHGCCVPEGGSIGPEYERSWIDHLVRRGAVVAYPMHWGTTGSVREATGAALAELAGGGHAPVDLNRVAVVGYSVGGPLAIDLAAAPPEGLPAPAALLLLAPECCPPEDLGAILATTRVLLVVFEDEQLLPESIFQEYWTALAAVPAERRAFVTLRSDAHGSPALVADHLVGFTEGEVYGFVFGLDALDWYGTWRLLDALMACSFAGEWCAYAFGDTPEVRFMGTWSDGVPVAEAVVAGEPGTPTP